MKILNRVERVLWWSATGIILIIIICNAWVHFSAKGFITKKIDDLPVNKVGVVPGTSKFIKRGVENPYFSNRIESAANLYFANKIQYILVSGDNSTPHYNEPIKMRDALIEKGVPADKIILDYAGLRTLDSVIRAKEVFGQKEYTFISQRFQDKRAVFIARQSKIKIVAFEADDVNGYAGLRVKIREALARVLVVADVFLIHKKPKYMGEKITFGDTGEI